MKTGIYGFDVNSDHSGILEFRLKIEMISSTMATAVTKVQSSDGYNGD